jgi:hypothetical protein
MIRFAKQWDAWWCGNVPPHALAIARIAVGLFWLAIALEYGMHLLGQFSSAGVAMPLLGDAYLPTTIFDAPSPAVTIILYVLLLLCLAGFTIGYRMRLCLVGILLLGFEFWQLSLHLFPATIHRVSLLFILVFLLGGADRTLSLRAFLQRGSVYAWEPICVLPQRLLAVQITATYLGAALQKLWLPGWQDGGILQASFMGSWATPFAFAIARLNLPASFYDAAVIGITGFEIALPICFWIPRVRKLAFIAGAFFHIAIALLLSIWSFLVLVPLYVLFLPPKTVARKKS